MNGSVITINISCLFGRELRQPILVWSRICKTYTINNNSIYLNIFTSWIIRYCIYISLINCGVLYYFILLFQINLPFKQCTVSISSYGVINFMTIRWRNKSIEIVSIHYVQISWPWIKFMCYLFKVPLC